MRRSIFFLLLFACGGPRSTTLKGADDTTAVAPLDLQAKVKNGAVLATTTDANLRDGPGSHARILRIVPAGAEVSLIGTTQPVLGFFSVVHDGVQGWINGSYVAFVRSQALTVPENWTPPSTTYVPPSTPPPEEQTPIALDEYTLDPTVMEELPPETAPIVSQSRDQAIARAQSGVGFSYWWGGGRWDPAGVSNNAGVCSGTCPNCTHSGSYGADCSGFVAKVWQVPASNSDPLENKHPYSTYVFNTQNYHWTVVERADLQKADALVYNEDGRGHIMLYESGDPWGSMWTYEARACSLGIVHNLRTVPSKYKAIRREGY